MELGGQFSTSHPGKNMHINKSKPNMAGSFFMVTVLFLFDICFAQEHCGLSVLR